MTTFFISGRIYRESDEHYWSLGLIVESFAMQDAVSQAEAFNTGLRLGSLDRAHYMIEGITTTKTRGREYVRISNSPTQLKELRQFLLEGKV